jgi:integrase
MACVVKRRHRYVLDYYDSEGKRQRETLPKGTSKEKAKERMREIEDQLAKGNYIPDKKIPPFETVGNDWLKYKKLNLRHTTWSTYEGIVLNHFAQFKDLKINRITTATVEKYITERQNEGMHINTLRKDIVALGQIMAYAVRHKYTSYNPVRDAERPRGQGDEQKAKIRILTPEEINRFLDAVVEQKYKTFFKLAIMSGARQGELIGLKWSDVDWQNNQIHIQRTFNSQSWFDVKTRTSNRRVDLGPSMMADLKLWRLACPPHKQNLIFPNESGQPMNHNNMTSRHFFPALTAAKINKIRFHDLRHTYASLMIEQGENIKYIQTQLGHSSPTVTLNVYAHLMKPVNQESARRFEDAILNATGHKMVTMG